MPRISFKPFRSTPNPLTAWRWKEWLPRCVLMAAPLLHCGGDADSAPLPSPPLTAPQRYAAPDASTGRDECSAPPAMSNGPRSMDELLDYINAMDKPLTLPCFLQSLPRPLSMTATEGQFSAQPAVGRRSPRFFLFLDPLILSVVPEGKPSTLLEMSEETRPARSVKGEIEFPVEGELTAESPFERLVFAEITTCGVCHDSEQPVGDIDGAVESEMLRPLPSEVIPLEEVLLETSNCDADLEPERCAILDAILGHGLIAPRSFPRSVPTFYE